MKNPIKRYKEWRDTLANNENESRVNSNVYVSNDPENGIYVFVMDVPVIKVVDGNNDLGNTLPIDKVAEFVGNIKRMFRNSINNKPINDDVQREEADS